jgi:hypothetical protein
MASADVSFPASRARLLGWKKIPTPTIAPITTQTASTRPSARFNSGSDSLGACIDVRSSNKSLLAQLAAGEAR